MRPPTGAGLTWPLGAAGGQHTLHLGALETLRPLGADQVTSIRPALAWEQSTIWPKPPICHLNLEILSMWIPLEDKSKTMQPCWFFIARSNPTDYNILAKSTQWTKATDKSLFKPQNQTIILLSLFNFYFNELSLYTMKVYSLHGHSPSQAISTMAQPALQLLPYVFPSAPHTGSKSSIQKQSGQGHSPWTFQRGYFCCLLLGVLTLQATSLPPSQEAWHELE